MHKNVKLRLDQIKNELELIRDAEQKQVETLEGSTDVSEEMDDKLDRAIDNVDSIEAAISALDETVAED